MELFTLLTLNNNCYVDVGMGRGCQSPSPIGNVTYVYLVSRFAYLMWEPFIYCAEEIVI